MIKSELTDIVALSNNHSGKRLYPVTRFTPHCVQGHFKASDVASWAKFHDGHTASMNYVIGDAGELLMQIPEEYRAWTSSNRDNDNRAITVECSSDATAPFAFNDAVYSKLVSLTVDVAQRYNKNNVIWIPDKTKALAYKPKDDELQITVHRFFANVECCGQWLIDKMPDYVAEVNARLHASKPTKLYCVQVGAFAFYENAERMKENLKKQGYTDAFIVEKGVNK